MAKKTIDLTLDDLVWGARGALRPVLQQIKDKWVGPNLERTEVPCGSVAVTNDAPGSKGRIIIDLQFPLDLRALKKRK